VTLTDAAAAHTPATDPDFSVSLGEHVTAVVSDGAYLYAALATSPAQVVKIDPTSMAEAGRWKGIANENTATSLACLGGSLFAGLNTAPGQVVQIDVAEMTTLSKWTGDIDEKYVWALASDGAYVYAGTGQFPFSTITAAAFVIKIDPATMSKASRYTVLLMPGSMPCFARVALFTRHWIAAHPWFGRSIPLPWPSQLFLPPPT
jgi:hypothetical protein